MAPRIEPAEKTGMRNAWSRIAGTYDALWAEHTTRFAEAGFDLLSPGGDERALDIGCGPGHTAAALARRLPRGEVLGIDFAPAMVEHAQMRWGDVPGLRFAVDDAEALSVQDSTFDLVASSFTLMYCYDAIGAVAEVARAVRPGGRVLLVVWGPHAAVWWSPVIDIIESRAQYYSSVCPMMFFYGLPGVLARMLEQVGLRVEDSQTIDEPIRYADPQQAVSCAILAGPLAGLFQNRLDDRQKQEAWSEMTAHVESVAQPDGEGITVPAQVLAVVASRPE